MACFMVPACIYCVVTMVTDIAVGNPTCVIHKYLLANKAIMASAMMGLAILAKFVLFNVLNHTLDFQNPSKDAYTLNKS